MSDLAGIPLQKQVFKEFFQSIYHALSYYSNVHRGSGQFSEVSTFLFEKSREIILEYLHKNKNKYQLLFCSPARAQKLLSHLDKERTIVLRSSDFGLPLGIVAIAVRRKDMNASLPFQPGGGTTKLISKDWVVWANAPDKFEGGTPPIINIIAFARALQLIKKHGMADFNSNVISNQSIDDLLYHDELQSYKAKTLLEELRKTLIGKVTFVPTINGKARYINLDNSASTPTFEAIWKTYKNTIQLEQSLYSPLIKEVKRIILSFVKACPEKYEVLFASNTTEAINIATEIIKARDKNRNRIQVISSYLEHSSNDLPWRKFNETQLKRVSVDKEGLLDYEEMKQFLNEMPENIYGEKVSKWLALSGASNVLGICTDLARISGIAKEHSAKVIIDAAQLIAHSPIEMDKYDLDALAFSAHKIYAPFGCGVLVIKKEWIEDHQLSYLSDEENVAGIAALGKALILMGRIGMENIKEEEKKLTQYLLNEMQSIPTVIVYGVQEEESKMFPNKIGVIPFNLKDEMSPKVARKLAWGHGIGVRYGCHCAHVLVKHIHQVGPGLEKFQKFMIRIFPKLKLPGVFRISLGCQNSMKDIEHFITALRSISQNRNEYRQLNSFHKSSLKELEKEAFENIFSNKIRHPH